MYTYCMPKKPMIAGNWKMELSYAATVELARAVKKQIDSSSVTSDIVVCPSFTPLAEVAEVLKKVDHISVGAQNIHYEEKGAWTGQVSVSQIRDFVEWCIVGHSEMRALLGESDEEVARKANILLEHRINPIICIGETGDERETDQTVSKITEQMGALLSTIDRPSFARLVIAYEPIWAIGTGVVPDPDDVSEVVLLIRKLVANAFSKDVADRLRILYGGSVKPENVGSYVGGPYADGVLVGGASLHPIQFKEIVESVQSSFE